MKQNELNDNVEKLKESSLLPLRNTKPNTDRKQIIYYQSKR